MKVLVRSCYATAIRLRVGSIRSPAALPRFADRGRAFLSEQPNNNPIGNDKGGQRRGTRSAHAEKKNGGHASLCPPYELHRDIVDEPRLPQPRGGEEAQWLIGNTIDGGERVGAS